MYWEQIKTLSADQFKRRTSVNGFTFEKMVKAVGQPINTTRRYPKRCRPPKLSTEDQLLMTLMYLREYRTLFHISVDYGISEATVSTTVHRIESILIQHPCFALPGKKAWLNSQNLFEVIFIDASESAIERPKKNNAAITQAKRRNTL